MGAIFPDRVVPCTRCGIEFKIGELDDEDTVQCAVCKKLGDRSLVWLLKNYGEEGVLERFHAARGRSWMRDDIERALEKGIEHLPPGVLQLAKERSDGR